MTRHINAEGLAIIKNNEGPGGKPVLHSYLCPAGVLTVGWGHTGPDVHTNTTVTEAQAENMLKQDIAATERCLTAWIKTATDNQFSAMVSFAFNEGVGKFRGSTLLKLHNAGDYAGAQKEFAKWTMADGKVLPGLVKRRAQEAALYGKA
jgi:lysozyme